ncbi:PAS domain-containing sensor histidine kinase [Methanomethylovorans sp.]|uniref:PAS domain-containing sensor histidine kinase n=1 Tax=Methanomethylovorans sp. TaxID=2758717 RepID=UPI00351CB1E7
MDEQNKVEKDIIIIWRVTLLYLFVASTWIISSDIVLEWFAPDITLYAKLQTYKGWVFVLVTGLLLYLYLKPRTESLRRSQKALFKAKEKLHESEEKYRELNQLNQSTLDSLDLNICVLDETGAIIKTNKSWQAFVLANSDKLDKLSEKVNYIQIIKNLRGQDSELALKFAKGIEDVISGTAEYFELEYPYHLSDEEQWFLEKVIPFEGTDTFPRKVVISHTNITDRKKAQKALEKHNEFAQAILDNLPIGLAVNEFDSGNANYMNAKFSDIYGWPQKELTSVPRFFELVYPDPDYRKKIMDRIMSDIQSGDINRMHWDDISICTKDKGNRWITAVNIPIFEQNIMISTVQDVTERKLMEMELRESEEDYRRLFEDHSAIKLLIDPDTGKIIQSNHAAAAYYGWTREELSQMTIQQINTHPPEVIDGEIRKVRAQKSVCFEFKHRLADGSTRDVEVFSSTIKMKGKELLHSIIHDVTDRKQAEKALLESESKFRSYITNAPNGIFIIDANANCLEVNTTAGMLTGYSEEELTGMNFNDLIAQEYRKIADQNLLDLKNNGSVFVELSFMRKDETICWLRIDASKLSETRYLVFASDITEKKKAEHSLISGKMMAEENSRIKSEFLANMSHELRTPLTAIIGFSDLLNIQHFGELNNKQLEFVGHISKSGKHLLNVINDVLDLSKIESGKMDLECEYFPVSKLIDEVQKSLYPLAVRKGIEVSISNNNKEHEIFADKLKLKQIMYNLLNNAIKFTPDNGLISVVVKRAGNTIEVSVSDTGIGIPVHMREEIFDPFVQVDASSKRKYGGTGLGLALTKRFVEMHNGKIWVESEEGKGSTFIFTLKDQNHIE